jgi:hypothetical protein
MRDFRLPVGQRIRARPEVALPIPLRLKSVRTCHEWQVQWHSKGEFGQSTTPLSGEAKHHAGTRPSKCMMSRLPSSRSPSARAACSVNPPRIIFFCPGWHCQRVGRDYRIHRRRFPVCVFRRDSLCEDRCSFFHSPTPCREVYVTRP